MFVVRPVVGILVKFAPDPLKVVAVIMPLTLKLPVPVTFLLLRFKFPPSSGAVS